jgi:hypothetical protein
VPSVEATAVWLGFAGGTWRRFAMDHRDRNLLAIDPGSEVLKCRRNAVTSLWITSRPGCMSLLNEQRQRNLRRHPRTRVNWPAILEAGTRVLQVEILNLSPWGAKVRLEDRWPDGTIARLHLTPPGGRPLEIQAMAWRTDADGSAFFFLKAAWAAVPNS